MLGVFGEIEEASRERDSVRGRIALCEGNHEELGSPDAAMGEALWCLQAENPKT